MNKRSFLKTAVAAGITASLPTLGYTQGKGTAKSMQLRVATGPGTGVFTKFFANIQQACPELDLVELRTAGASENLGRLLTLGAEIGFMQADFLWAAWKLEGKEEVGENVKTILPLYDSPLHMIAVDEKIQKFSDMAGRRIGVFGGGAITLRIIMAKAGVNAEVKNFSREERPEVAMMQALQRKEIDVAVGIGGFPIPWVESINTSKGLAIPGAHLVNYDRFDTVKDLAVGSEKGFYKLRTLDYPNMPGTAQTITVVSLIVSARNWPAGSPETRAIQDFFRLVTSRLSDLKDTRKGYHPAWIQVNPLRDPTWPWYGNLRASGKK